MTWIKTTDRLPEPGERVLVYDKSIGTIHMAYLQTDGQFRICLTDDKAKEPTHWQALPKHPNDWSWINRVIDRIKCANT